MKSFNQTGAVFKKTMTDFGVVTQQGIISFSLIYTFKP